jgi:hypothetical protein
MNTKNFLNNENVKVLWDVVIDEDIVKRQSREFQENILNLFRSNLKGFYDVESQKTTNLIDMNKKYILLILNYANKQIKQNVKPEYRKIKILDELPEKKVNELITYEEIHNDKRSQFDKDLNRRQEEFSNSMSLQVPPVPKFTDNLDDGPIHEIEKAIKELTSQRNYDVEQINKSNNNSLSTNVDNWLKPQETSVKNDKLTPQSQNIKNGNINGNNNRLKYLKTDNESVENQVISLDREKQMSPKKNVTWDLKPYNYFNEGKTDVKDQLLNEVSNEVRLTMEEILNETDNDNEEDANIFKLLKKVPLVKDTNDNKIAILQTEVKTLNSKLDLILELLKNKN